MKSRAEAAFLYAYNVRLEAKAKHLTPRAYVMGFFMYYELKWYCLGNHPCEFEDASSIATLFGLPIRIAENDRFEISLELDEYSCDFSGFLSGTEIDEIYLDDSGEEQENERDDNHREKRNQNTNNSYAES